MKMMKFLDVSMAAALFVACGDSVTEVVSPADSITVSHVDSLPACSFENRGRTAFVSEEAAVYVCEDSKWNNLAASPKSSPCALEMLSDSSGYKLLCDGDSVGFVKNGVDGLDGAVGERGARGEDGAECSLADVGDGTVLQICGGDTVVFQKALCGGVPYEPSQNFCYGDLLYPQVVYDTIVDARDGNRYRTVRIGSQTWMADNLRFETEDSDCLGDPTRCHVYGRYYLWMDILDTAGEFGEPLHCDIFHYDSCLQAPRRGICPEGFHLPSRDEWTLLYNYVDRMTAGEVGTALKSKTGWDALEDAEKGIDLFGFDAKPSGGYFYTARSSSYWRSEAKYIFDQGIFWAGDMGFLQYWFNEDPTEGTGARDYKVIMAIAVDKYGQQYFIASWLYDDLGFEPFDLRAAVRCLKD